jgi:hypothetical protein
VNDILSNAVRWENAEKLRTQSGVQRCVGNGRTLLEVLGFVPIPFSNGRNVLWLCNWGNMSKMCYCLSFQGL